MKKKLPSSIGVTKRLIAQCDFFQATFALLRSLEKERKKEKKHFEHNLSFVFGKRRKLKF